MLDRLYGRHFAILAEKPFFSLDFGARKSVHACAIGEAQRLPVGAIFIRLTLSPFFPLTGAFGGGGANAAATSVEDIMTKAKKRVAATPLSARQRISKISKGKNRAAALKDRTTRADLRTGASTVAPTKGKLATIIAMLRKAPGASIAALCDATGWQAHSVRGAMSGTLKKKLGLTIESTKRDDIRLYRIVD